MVTGTPKANAIVLSSVTITLLSEHAMQVRAEAKLVNTADGTTHATTTATQFTPPVMQKISELKEAMEQSIGEILFIGGSDEVVTGAPTGLGETFRNRDEVPSL